MAAFRLAPRFAVFARGLDAYLAARADSAVAHFRAALELDSEWPEAWMALGEVYTHLLPSASPLDSLAAAAFDRVHRYDPGFAPVLFHMIEHAVRMRDDRRARRLLDRFRAAHPDSAELAPVELMVRCLRGTLQQADWYASARRHPDAVFEAATSLAAAGLRQARCARDGWRAVLAVDSAATPPAGQRRWGAFLGLQNFFVATGQTEELRRLFAEQRDFGAARLDQLYILDAVAGAGVARAAADAARRLREAYRANPDLSATALWFLGTWEAHSGAVAGARALRDTIGARVLRTGDRLAGLLAASLAARIALAEGDSSIAVALLDSLVPTAPRGPLRWYPWESLGAERLAVARIRLARGEYEAALGAGAALDAPAPVAYVMGVPASLAVRIKAAEALGDRPLASNLRARLDRLNRDVSR
jgi:hypothetical protein